MGETTNGNTPDFIREYSKETDKEGRSETASQIWEKRQENRDRLEQVEQIKAKVGELKDNLDNLESNWVNKVLKQSEIKATRGEIGQLESDLDKKENPEQTELEEAKAILNGYYEKQKESWSHAEFGPDEVKRYFTEEYLSRLDIDQYALLLSRFPSEFATHVTRQGIRDHSGMLEHRASMDELSNNFIDALQDGRLRSVIGKLIKEDKTEEALAGYMKWLCDQMRKHAFGSVELSDRELFKNSIDEISRGWNEDPKEAYPHFKGSYGDRLAFHMARDVVLDEYYGAEKGNEIFFAYPVGHLFAEHKFSNTSGGIEKNNDLWIWTKDRKGLNINAGIVFIPGYQEVDRRTGSKYEIDERGNPVVDQDRYEAVTKLFEDPKFIDLLDGLYKKLDTRDSKNIQEIEQEFDDDLKNIGISDSNLRSLLRNTMIFSEFKHGFRYRSVGPDVSKRPASDWSEQLLRDTYCYYKKASDRIPAQEYWENYFSQNPNLKPNKIVYYGGDPTKALDEWAFRHKIRAYSKNDSVHNMHDKYSTQEENAKVGFEGYEKFNDICYKVLDKYFPEEERAEVK